MKPLLWMTILTASCASVAPSPPVVRPANAAMIEDAIFVSPTELVFIAAGGNGCTLNSVALAAPAGLRPVAIAQPCGNQTRLVRTASGVIISTDSHSYRVSVGPETLSEVDTVSASAASEVQRRASTLEWAVDGKRLDLGADARDVAISPGELFVAFKESSAAGDRLVMVDRSGARKTLFESTIIDSFAIDSRDKQVAVVAVNGSQFDVGMIDVETGEIKWVAPDQAAERGVTWAPKGNKITYIIQRADGDTLRSVHVPSGFQVTTNYDLARVRKIAWEPGAEKIAVIWSSPTRSDQIDLLKYDGSGRRTVVPAEKSLEGYEPDVASIDGSSVVTLRRNNLHYGMRLPVVVVVAEEPIAWNDTATAIAQQIAEVAVVLAPRRVVGSRLFEQLKATEWMDAARVIVVEGNQARIEEGEGGKGSPAASRNAEKLLLQVRRLTQQTKE
jgi:hypothetical protein